MTVLGTSPPARAHIDAVGAVDGLARGRAFRAGRGGEPRLAARAARVTMREAITKVRDELARMLRALPRAQRELFEPEVRILEELAPRLLTRDVDGQSREGAVVAETGCGCTDLVMDLRVRLLDALDGSSDASELAARLPRDEEVVLLADLVTPSLIAALPSGVTAVVASCEGDIAARRDVGPRSHAAILARARGLPMVYVAPERLASIPNGARLIVAAREGRAAVHVEPQGSATARRGLAR